LSNQLSDRIFTPGPTPVPKHILELAAQQPPYNRTQAFSDLTFELLSGLKQLFQTSGDVVVLTSSGTGAMEASILGFLNHTDNALIINGGTFGQRWVDLCVLHKIPFEEIHLEFGKVISAEQIEEKLKESSCNVLLMTAHETATGVLHDVAEIGRIAHKNDCFFVVDAISSICADTFLMDKWFVDVAVLSSQKALALPPGLSFIALNQKAKDRLKKNRVKSYYFDLVNQLKDQERGQMPFTPAISLFVMLRQRLADILKASLDTVISEHASLARYFRSRLIELPFSILPKRSSNAMTALQCDNSLDATDLVHVLQTQYKIFVAPSGGQLRSTVFRVSHMGEQSRQDIDYLIQHLRKVVIELGTYRKRGIVT